MEKSSKRGKIPQSDWPLIMARYEAGETLASIARTYDCSPPAISYVVSRSRARVSGQDIGLQPAAKPIPASEPQLIKAAAGEAAANGAGHAEASAGDPVPNGHAPTIDHGASEQNGSASPNGKTLWGPPGERAGAPGQRDEAPPSSETHGFTHNGSGGSIHGMNTEPNGVPRAATGLPRQSTVAPAHTNGTDQRRTLHLALGGGGPANGGGQSPETASGPRLNPQHRAQPQVNSGAPYRHEAAEPTFSEVRPVFDDPRQRHDGDASRRKDSGSFIDRELRARVDADIAAFLTAFDGALEQDTQESRSALREATDRLLRAGARTRIELERLEARIPLPPREAIGNGEPAWRHR